MVLLISVSQPGVVFLVLSLFCRGQAEGISVTQTVKAKLGDDAVLPCQMDPPKDAISMTVEWGRPDLRPRFVFVWFDGKELVRDQNPAYSGRASMSTDKLKTGDLSMTLSGVKISDNGTYRCWIPTLDEEYIVDLLVGASSSPVISLVGHDKVSSGVMIDCESKGLYPEPEVLWLDSKGDVHSADLKKSVKGPDGLFSVSSRVTLMRRHNNVFTCKLQQKTINWTSEAHIYIPDDFFVVTLSCTTSIVFAVLFGLMLVAAFGLLVWQWKMKKAEMNQLKNTAKDKSITESIKDLEERKELLRDEEKAQLEVEKRPQHDEEKRAQLKEEKTSQLEEKKKPQLEEEKRPQHDEEKRAQLEEEKRAQLEEEKRAQLEEEKRAQLKEELQNKEEEQKEITHVLETLTGLLKALETQRKQLDLIRVETDELREERDKKIESLHQEVLSSYDLTRRGGYNKLIEIFQEDSEKQKNRKKGLKDLDVVFEKLIIKTYDDINQIKKRQGKVENQVEQINKKINSIQKLS